MNITLTDRERETIHHALRLFAEGANTTTLILSDGTSVQGKRPGYLSVYSPDEFRTYFQDAVNTLSEKIK